MYCEQRMWARPSDEEVIWRFTDLSKLIHIIDNQALSFCRLDRFEDKYEGYIPKGNILLESNLQDIPISERTQLAADLNKNILNLARTARQSVFVNCWHINEHESAAMWKLYLRSSEGVAIRSTFKRLKDSFCDARHKVDIGKVEYLDYDTARVETAPTDRLALSMRKRKSFEHEHELRVVHWDPMEWREILLGTRTENSKKIILIPVNIDILIEKVFINPTSHPSYEALIKSVLEKYGVDKQVQQSSLAKDPIW